MIEGISRVSILLIVAVCLASESTVNARYLPTRSQDDRLERLRELLKDLLESQAYDNRVAGDVEPSGPISFGPGGPARLFKRDAELDQPGTVHSSRNIHLVPSKN